MSKIEELKQEEDAAWKAYEEATAPAWKAYQEAKARLDAAKKEEVEW